MHDRDGDPLILADEDKLSQVIFNLLSNALKYTSRGGEIHVVLTTIFTEELQSYVLRAQSKADGVSVGDEGFLRIDVVDSGRGMSKVRQLLPNIISQLFA